MALVEIAPPAFDVEIHMVYATAGNFTGAPVYGRAACYLHEDAAALLERSVALAAALGLRLKLYDAFRPAEAQWLLWSHNPDPEFLADPRRGSPHSRGVAVDVTLIDGAGRELDMGSPVDGAGELAHHGRTDIAAAAQRNRLILLGLIPACTDRDPFHRDYFARRPIGDLLGASCAAVPHTASKAQRRIRTKEPGLRHVYLGHQTGHRVRSAACPMPRSIQKVGIARRSAPLLTPWAEWPV